MPTAPVVSETNGIASRRSAASTFIYEITSTNLDTVQVGSFIVDTAEASHRGEPRTWRLYNEATGKMTVGFSGVVLHQVCTGCRALNVLRIHRHDGDCGNDGTAPRLTPRRIKATGEAATR